MMCKDGQTTKSKPGLHSPGRPRSIPPELFTTILQLYAQGWGYRSITRHLEGLGIATTYTTVRRLILGQGAYAKCFQCGGSGRMPRAVPRVPEK